jgi:hypothetical protein
MGREIPLQEPPGLLERLRAQLSPQDYQVLEPLVLAGRVLDKLHLLGLSPEELVAAVQALEQQAGASAPHAQPGLKVPRGQSAGSPAAGEEPQPADG